MLPRLGCLFVLVAATSADATPAIDVKATCAADVAHGPRHTRLVRDELTRALAGITATHRFTLDVSLVRLDTTHHAAEVEVRAELRGLLSDKRGRIHLSSSASAVVRGRTRQHEQLRRDAVTEVARQFGTRLRTQWPDSRERRVHNRPRHPAVFLFEMSPGSALVPPVSRSASCGSRHARL
jgi:hypothetical protein